MVQNNVHFGCIIHDFSWLLVISFISILRLKIVPFNASGFLHNILDHSLQNPFHAKGASADALGALRFALLHDSGSPSQWWNGSAGHWRYIPSRGLTYPTLGKRKIIFKMPFLGDMLVSWRVNLANYVVVFSFWCFFAEGTKKICRRVPNCGKCGSFWIPQFHTAPLRIRSATWLSLKTRAELMDPLSDSLRKVFFDWSTASIGQQDLLDLSTQRDVWLCSTKVHRVESLQMLAQLLRVSFLSYRELSV